MRQAPIGRRLLAVAALLAIPGVSSADVRPNPLFSDGAVLQRGRTVPVWGSADEGEKVTVKFQGQEVSAEAGKDGKWMVRLARLEAGGPFAMTIEGKDKVEVADILVGEVWVCSGQSNMEFVLGRAAEAESAVPGSADPQLRLFTVAHAVSDEPLGTVKVNKPGFQGAWFPSTPESSAKFSAVAYFFGRDLRKAIGVPVGLIHSSWGGTAAEAWTDRATLEADPALRTVLDDYARALERLPEAEERYKKAQADHREAVARAKEAGKTPPGAPRQPVGPKTPHPAALYNAMLVPLQPYAIRGALWYQGETNAGRAHQYRALLPAMIRNWRAAWGQGDFPFLIVQLAPFQKIVSEPGESNWAELREAQWLTARAVPAAGMAVITDVGNETDVHPRQKEPVGARLALAARSIAHGETIVASGPDFAGLEIDGDRAIVRFRHVGKGLVARDGPLKGFAIAGDDRKFVVADAEIEGDTVVVHSPGVSHPVAVRFGWAGYPVVNLWNADGLPASPFRTDDFPMITAPKPRPATSPTGD